MNILRRFTVYLVPCPLAAQPAERRVAKLTIFDWPAKRVGWSWCKFRSLKQSPAGSRWAVNRLLLPYFTPMPQRIAEFAAVGHGVQRAVESAFA